MSLQERITLAVQVAGPTLAVLTFLTTFRAGEPRGVVDDKRSRPSDFWVEAIICTVLPLLTMALFALTQSTAADAWATVLRHGFRAPLALFVLMQVLIAALVIYQVLLAIKAWTEWTDRK